MEDTAHKTPAELIKSSEFESALNEGATYKQGILTTYKTQNKDNYKRFQEVMYENNPEVKKILEKRKKDRSEDDNKKLADFKQYVASIYRLTTDLIVTEKVEEGKKSKIEKIVDKMIPVIEMLEYIDNDILKNELAKRGFTLTGPSFASKFPAFATDAKKTVIKDIFTTSKNIREKVNADNEHIETEIYQGKVPIDLQYDKQSNNSGLKAGDFKKLVDMKTRLIMAQTDEAKEKVEDKIEHIAGEKQFEAARAELTRDALTNMQ